MADPFAAEREVQAFCREILADLDGLRVVQPGEIVLTSEQAEHLWGIRRLNFVADECPACAEIAALLASGPGGEAEA